MDIPLDLPPAEFKAAHVLARASRLRTVEIAELVGITERHARRVLAHLLGAGLIERETRGLYRLVRSGERTSMSGNLFGYMATSSKAVLPEDTSYLQSGGDIPPRGMNDTKETSVARDDYETEGDDLGGLGLTEPRPSLTKRVTTAKAEAARPKVPAAHRDVSRDRWTMDFVAKEFRLRARDFGAQPTIATWRERTVINPTGGNSLVMTLKAWQAQQGITPQEAATLLDRFFDDPKQTDRIDSSIEAYRIYLDYLKRNVDLLRRESTSAHVRDLIDSQVISWD